MARVRLALTLPGAVSLGSYEGGALAALLVALREIRARSEAEHADDVVVDAIASASAGSITALLATHSMLRGSDAVALMQAAWVDDDSLRQMRSHDNEGPLSIDVLRRMAGSLLVSPTSAGAVQREGVVLSMTIASLANLGYTLKQLEGQTDVSAVTHLDHGDVALGPDDADPAYQDYVPLALASAANAIGFPPICLDRRAAEPVYEAAGIENFPTSGSMWFTDGGTIDNEPIGRTLELVHDLETLNDLDHAAGRPSRPPDDAKRIFLLVHPGEDIPDDPTTSPWFDPRRQPAWAHVFMRAWGMMSTQSIYADLKQVEQVNRRLAEVDDLATAMAASIGDADPAAGQAALALAIQAAIADATTDLGESPGTRAAAAATVDDASATDLASTLAAAMRAAAGLDGKHPVTVEVVSPATDPEKHRPADQQLAGDMLARFGGFLDLSFRRNDYAIGYRNMATWLSGALPTWGLDDGVVTAALAAVAEGTRPDWIKTREGRETPWTMPWRDRWQLVRLALKFVGVTRYGLAHWEGTPVPVGAPPAGGGAGPSTG